MNLDISLHKTILFQILKDIASDSTIASFLGFKGGTAAMMFYGLDRFSVDLDFDLLDEAKEEYVFEQVLAIISQYGTIKDAFKKRLNLLCVLSYEDEAHNIKVEISRRQFGSNYELKTYLGTSMLVMSQADMFAHKLMALHERLGSTSRDLYDVWFFLTHHFPINKSIVEKRANMPFSQLVEVVIRQISDMSERTVLDGVGELLTESKKDWAREKLRDDTIALLHLLI